MEKNSRPMRKVDIGLLINLATLGGMIYVFVTHPVKWDAAASKVDQLEIKVEKNSSDLAVQDAHFSEILRRLDSIDKKIGR